MEQRIIRNCSLKRGCPGPFVGAPARVKGRKTREQDSFNMKVLPPSFNMKVLTNLACPCALRGWGFPGKALGFPCLAAATDFRKPSSALWEQVPGQMGNKSPDSQ